ncbi:hypothetical protein BGX27_011118, partial [Mortierella sp. AM989]
MTIASTITKITTNTSPMQSPSISTSSATISRFSPDDQEYDDFRQESEKEVEAFRSFQQKRGAALVEEDRLHSEANESQSTQESVSESVSSSS